jgi:N-acylglucosamine 2-epimerase (GlcNAc 2-epimerase)
MTTIDASTIAADGRDIVKTLKTLLIEHSLPLWSREGWDQTGVGLVEKLDIEGRANPAAPRRVRVLLALSSVYRLTGDAQVRDEIEALIGFLDTDLPSPHGGFAEGIPTILPRRQNSQMHLFEAMIAAFDATGDPKFQNSASDLYSLFVASLFDPQRQVLGEYFEDDRPKIEPVYVEPGHQAEWVWLLKGFEPISGCVTRCLVDEGDAGGNIRKFTRRCWPWTEIAKTWIAQTDAGEPGAAYEARDALNRLYGHYLRHPVPGGVTISSIVTIGYSLRIVCAIAEAERILGYPRVALTF